VEPSLRFADVLRVIRARRNVVILMLAVALAAAVLNSLITTPTYQSKVTLELLQPSGYVIRADVLSSLGGSGRTHSAFGGGEECAAIPIRSLPRPW
jgi:uncharacterized protein involved in exopolysaccharide biosynthesis